MAKSILIVIVIAFLVYFALSTERGGDFVRYLGEHTDPLRDRVENIFEERKEIVEGEMEKEKEQIKEEAKETGKNFWERMMDSLFGDSNKDKEEIEESEGD